MARDKRCIKSISVCMHKLEHYHNYSVLKLKIISINLLILIFCTLTTEIPCTPDQKLFNGILQLILYNAIAHRFYTSSVIPLALIYGETVEV